MAACRASASCSAYQFRDSSEIMQGHAVGGRRLSSDSRICPSCAPHSLATRSARAIDWGWLRSALLANLNGSAATVSWLPTAFSWRTNSDDIGIIPAELAILAAVVVTAPRCDALSSPPRKRAKASASLRATCSAARVAGTLPPSAGGSCAGP